MSKNASQTDVNLFSAVTTKPDLSGTLKVGAAMQSIVMGTTSTNITVDTFNGNIKLNSESDSQIICGNPPGSGSIEIAATIKCNDIEQAYPNSDVVLYTTPSTPTFNKSLQIGTVFKNVKIGSPSSKIYMENTPTTSTTYMTITVGPGDSGATGTLQIYGNIKASGTISTLSDYRAKTDVKSLNSDETTTVLNPVSFRYSPEQNLCYGFIAHEVQEHYPDLVLGEKDGPEMQSLNYLGMISLLVNDIRLLNRRVAALEAQSAPS